ncbi:MAG: hypothetical protein IJT72_06615 [Lachnospiraceae bacterium]|nr:hypothetical protein [Lachnospiraceae bacterium]
MKRLNRIISIICSFLIMFSLFPGIQSYAIKNTYNTINNGAEHFTSIQSGSQNAVSDNLKNPLSAWKLTNATLKKYSSSNEIPYSIRLEELYYGQEANNIISEENPYNDKPSESQQWIVMKFYLKNNGNQSIEANDIIWYRSFYTQKGASMLIRSYATFSGQRNGMDVYDLNLEGGASGYFWIGFLAEKEQGLPYIKIYNGYSNSEYTQKYSWLNINPAYTYNPSKPIIDDNISIPALPAENNNLSNPLSAWSMTYARTSEYSSTGIPYYIRLEEMYTGNEANTIVATENQFNTKPADNQQWILMKFYLKNAGTKPFNSSDIIWSNSFYTSSGASMIIKGTASFCDIRTGMDVYDLDLEGGADGYFWIGILTEKDQGLPYIKIENGYNKSEFKANYCWLNTDSNYKYQGNNNSNVSSILSSGIFCQSTSPAIVAGMVVEKSNPDDTIEYRWEALDADNQNNGWFEISQWTSNYEWVSWTPQKYGNYIIVAHARIFGRPETEVTASFGTPYHNHIKGICQMPYTGEGGGFLIGFESFDNPNQSYTYEMLILDCTLLAAGQDAWIYTTGRCGVAEGNALWTIWQPQYGYYWTLFRLYDSSGNMIDEACFGFVNAY